MSRPVPSSIVAALLLGFGELVIGASVIDRSSPFAFPVSTTSTRVNCVVDVDTRWLHGTKIRIENIDAPKLAAGDADERQRAIASRSLRRHKNLGSSAQNALTASVGAWQASRSRGRRWGTPSSKKPSLSLGGNIEKPRHVRTGGTRCDNVG